MKKYVNSLIMVFILIVLVLSGCSNEKSDSQNETNGDTGMNTNLNHTTSPSGVDDNKQIGADVKTFIDSISKNDAEAFMHSISTTGFILIRNFSSGNGTRGMDIRNIYTTDTIPSNLQFEVNGETPIALNELFKSSQQTPIKDTPIIRVSGISFNFKDEPDNGVYEPSTDDIRDICSNLISTENDNNKYIPKVFELDNKEIVLTESGLINDIPDGDWAVFENVNDKYMLRAIIVLR